jgi:hypothetical protein
MMDPKKYDSVVVLIASKNWTIWKHKWQKINGQNVQLKVVHILIYHYVMKLMKIRMMQ